jgi:hypothetical protein
VSDSVIENVQNMESTRAASDGPPPDISWSDSPQGREAIALNQGKLVAMLAAKGAPAPTTTATKPTAPKTETPQEIRARLANDPEDPASRTADDMAGADQSDRAEWAGTLRARFGVEVPPTPGLEPDENYDLHSGNALAYLAREGADPKTVQELFASFHEELVSGVGVLSDDQIERLEQRFAPKLGKAAAGRLKNWYKREVRGDAS